MERRSEQTDAIPPVLRHPTPRPARLTPLGIAALAAAAALLAGGIWQAASLLERAKASERRVRLFPTEAMPARARIVSLRRNDDGRTTLHYSYDVGDRRFNGRVRVRRNPERYREQSEIVVHYLRSEPGVSWLDGSGPRREPVWPAAAVAAGSIAATLVVVWLVRRQSSLLSYGRAAAATVTRVARKRDDGMTSWQVDYEWRLLSGATRTGRYRHTKRKPPETGAAIPVVYDRDRPSRHMRFPGCLVTVGRIRP